MAPAKWRVDNSGNVKGFVRRKGDPNPMNWAYKVDASILNHPKIGMIRTEVPEPKPKKKKNNKKKKRAKKNEAGGLCAVM
ncbi:hypothetical protein NHQ30_009548 [Ciborinia camelliae]|nr:hypothetical protein NHQ30_009548 [Ciborinia camelliae]